MKNVFTLLLVLMLTLELSAQQTFMKSYDYWDRAEAGAIFEETDGYVIAGCGDKGTDGYFFLVKTDLYGDTLWTRNYPIGYTTSYVNSYETDQQGNKYILVNPLNNQNVFKFDSNWNLMSTNIADSIRPIHIKVLNDNNLLVVGWIGTSNMVLYKMDGDFNLIWKSDTLFNSRIPNVKSVLELENNDIVVISTEYGDYEPEEAFSSIYHCDQNGNLITTFETSSYILGNAFAQGNELLSIKYNNSFSDSLTMMMPDGTNISNTDISIDQTVFKSFIVSNNNSIITLGKTFQPENLTQHVALAAFRQDGTNLWTSYFGDESTNTDKYYPESMFRCSDKGYLVVGEQEGQEQQQYVPFLIKADSTGKINPIGIEEHNQTNSINVYPNPVKKNSGVAVFNLNSTKADMITIFESYGKIITVLKVTSGKVEWPVSNVASGFYYYRVTENNDNVVSGKLIVY